MSAFRGILTGFGMAAIKDKEAKDNMRMKVAQEAGIDFYKTDIPQHEKEMKLYESDFKNVSEIYGVDVANYFGTKTGIFGTGKALNDVSSILDKYNLDKEQLKNMDLSTFDERKNKRNIEFDKKKKLISEMTGMQLGTYTLENQLSDVQDTTEIPQPADFGTLKEGETTDTAAQTTDSSQKINADVSSLFTKKPDVQGVESKYNSISKAVNEQMKYGDPMYRADGSVQFNITDDLKATSNAHVRIASVLTANDQNITQIDAVSLAKQELDNQTVTPFNILASSIDGGKYKEGTGGMPAFISGSKSGKVDITTQIKTDNFEGTIRQFLENVYANVLLDDGKGNTDEAVFAKFLENIPDNLVANAGTTEEQKYKEIIASSHSLRNYYSKY